MLSFKVSHRKEFRRKLAFLLSSNTCYYRSIKTEDVYAWIENTLQGSRLLGELYSTMQSGKRTDTILSNTEYLVDDNNVVLT